MKIRLTQLTNSLNIPHMKYSRLLTAIMMLTGVLTACSDQENEQDGANERTALSINAGIGVIPASTSSATTRATDASWQANDAIGIVMLDAGTNTVTEGKTNYRYITTTGNGSFTPDGKEHTAYYPTAGAQVDVLAYYPYTTTISAGSLNIPVDVSDQSNPAAIDLMTAEKVTGRSSKAPDVSLMFTHRLCKLVLKVVKDETTSDVTLTGATAILAGTATTGNWNLITEKLSTEGEARDLTLPLSADGTIATAIVMPTQAGDGKSITVTTADGKSYTATIAANLALAAGTVNTYTMTLHRNQASITAGITPWTDGTTVPLESLHIEVPADATANGLTTFEMWRNQAQKTDTRIYTFSNNGNSGTGTWTATPKPFYIEEIATTDHFYALHTPADDRKDGLTGLKDLLAAGPASLQSSATGSIANSLSLNFKHLMAQLTVTLAPGKDFPTGVSTEGATVILPEMISGYTLDGITLTADDTKKTGYKNITVTSGRTAILTVVPQTLSQGTEISVKLTGGNTYKTTLGKAVALSAGSKTSINLTISPTQTAISVSVNPWTDTDAVAQNITIEGIEIGSATGSYESADKDLLVLTGTNETIPTEKHTASYIYNKVNKQWNSNAPLYWDSFSQFAAAKAKGGSADAAGDNTGNADSNTPCTFRFDALIIPAVTPTEARIACGAVKDYLQGSLTATTFGTPLSFRLSHLMAQISVTLKPGIGYTAEDLSQNVTVHLYGLHTLTNEGVETDGTLILSKEAASSPLKMNKAAEANAEGNFTYTALVAPQTIVQGNLVARITLTAQEADRTTPVSLSYDYRAGSNGFVYRAGQNNKLVLTVSKAGVSAVFTLTDWDDSQEATEGDVTVD